MSCRTNYQSYMLRFYQGEKNGQATLRIFLEHIQTGQQYDFASMQALFEFLKECTGLHEKQGGEHGGDILNLNVP